MIEMLLQQPKFDPTLRIILIVVFFVGMALIVLSRFYMYFEQQYALKHKKPFFIHSYFFKRKLTPEQHTILRRQFRFYNTLTPKQKKQFEHRLATFIRDKKFVGREDIEVTSEMRVLISATAVMLTFGFKRYLIDLMSVVIIYPKEFFSTINETYHKGEFNPQLQTLVLSWKHFVEGYDRSNDNLNLGIHEITHAIHLNSYSSSDISSILFNEGFMELTNFLSENETLRKDLLASKYFRDYAYTNQFEFIAVIIENFIETPSRFRSQFPQLYLKTKQMLNFNFAGY